MNLLYVRASKVAFTISGTISNLDREMSQQVSQTVTSLMVYIFRSLFTNFTCIYYVESYPHFHNVT